MTTIGDDVIGSGGNAIAFRYRSFEEQLGGKLGRGRGEGGARGGGKGG